MTQSLLSLLLLGMGYTTTTDEKCQKLLCFSMGQWYELMAVAEQQGVLAIAVDGLQVLMEAHKEDIVAVKESPAEWQLWLLENIGQLTQYEMMNHQQRKVIAELSEMWAAEGIRMMVFKGQANAAFYPKPEHRAVGDIDCWLFGDAEKADNIMKNHGADVNFKWYRHSKISFQGETIENHRVMSHTRGNKKHKKMEEELLQMAKESLNHKVDHYLEGCGKALKASAQFNACFLTYHGLHHFTSEGLRLKQILDWAMFLQKEQDEVDWNAYWDFCRRYKLDRFAAVMNYIAMHFLNVDFNANYNENDVSVLAENVLRSTLYDDDYLFNSGKSDWMVRWSLVKNMFTRDRWKYRDIAQKTVWLQLWQNVTGFMFDKD